MSAQFPSDSWEYVIGGREGARRVQGRQIRAGILPAISRAPRSRMRTRDAPLVPGLRGNGLDLGSIEHHDVPARVSMTRLLQKHLAILAMSGAGKSHLASVLLEELMDRKKEDGRIAVVIIDIHGEYAGFLHDPVYGKMATCVEGNGHKHPPAEGRPRGHDGMGPEPLGAAARRPAPALWARSGAQKKDAEGYGFKELIDAIDSADVSKDEVKRALKRSLSELKRYRFLSRKTREPEARGRGPPGPPPDPGFQRHGLAPEEADTRLAGGQAALPPEEEGEDTALPASHRGGAQFRERESRGERCCVTSDHRDDSARRAGSSGPRCA